MTDPRLPDDGFADYFAEKLWAMIPAFYREEDGNGDPPGTLRALVELIADQAAARRRSQDRLWDDQFIDLCDDWAVPYIGALVATRLVAAPDMRGRRVDVAKTIYYRRRKGTLRVLEELIADITGWDGIVVESFRGLGRARHGLDPTPAGRLGRFSGSPPGGTADLRRPLASTLTGGPYDEYAHTLDVRQARGLDGRWNIPKLAFHLYRLRAIALDGVTPFARADGKTFTFDPSGRDVPLFMRRQVARDWDAWRPALPWELPAPMLCRFFNDAEMIVGEGVIASLVAAGLPAAAAADLETIRGEPFPDEPSFVRALLRLPSQATVLLPGYYEPLYSGALVAGCGRQALWPNGVDVQPAPAAPPTLPAAADLSDWSVAVPTDRWLLLDPALGRFKLAAAPLGPLTTSYAYGISGPTGAGGQDRSTGLGTATVIAAAGPGALNTADIPTSGVLEIPDSATRGPVGDRDNIGGLVIQASNFTRPYLRLATDWHLQAATGTRPTLTLDGLWIGAAGAARNVVLAGDYSTVTLQNLTLDPGGVDVDGNAIPAVTLTIAGQVENLVVASSILGPIALTTGSVVDQLQISDSVVQALSGNAIDLSPGATALARVTVLGPVHVERLSATETLITGSVDVVDTQDGCFRFSAAPDGSRLPRAFESYVIEDTAALFTSTRFGQPGYAELSLAAPQEIFRGAENGSEMGAWSGLANPIKADSLARKVDEFAPFGLIPIFIYQD